ncbi:hypothetical protein BDV12DRAFT_201539 [Aspergillus spectabilis]
MRSKLLSALVALSFGCSSSAEGISFPGIIIERDADLFPVYDYVVVGGGVSGLVVANRLTEDSRTTVLVIEAGKIDNYSQAIQYPRYLSMAAVNHSWPITSLPVAELNNCTALVGAARVLGGGSAINGMASDRGSPGDYNLWGEIIGDQSWSWEGLLPYFKKGDISVSPCKCQPLAETFTPPTEAQQKQLGISYNMDVHGTTGPVQSSYPPFISGTAKVFLDALRQLRIPIQLDGTANALGGFWNPNSLDPVTRERSYARTTYHELSKKRRNYHVLPEALVTRLTPDLSGVEYIAEYNPALTATPLDAKKITLFGIGSSRVLNSLGVEQILDLPGVGENFQDHPTLYGSLALTNLSDLTQESSYLNTNATYDAEMGALYELNRTGPWTVATGNTFSFLTAQYLNLSTTNLVQAAEQPAEKYLRPGLDRTILRGYDKIKAAMLQSMIEGKVALTENLFGGVASLQKPLSRGSIRAASADPYNMPLSVRFNTDFLPQTPAYKAIGAVMQSPAPGLSDTELAAVIKTSAFPSFAHPSGSCAMLRLGDGGCVDNKLRLYGSKGRVRVVDASIFPVVPSSHTQSTVYAVAEKAADIIRRQHWT